MPIEIEAGLSRSRWTTTHPQVTARAPFAGLGAVAPAPVAVPPMPKGTVPGIRIRIFKLVESTWMAAGAGASDGRSGYTTRTPTKGEISLLTVPAMQAHGFELVGQPKYVVDEHPIWLWRSAIAACKDWCAPQCTYQLYVGSGPFKGLTGSCMEGPPNVGDTVKHGAKAIVEWTGVFRSTDLELPSSKIGQIRETERSVRKVLAEIAGHGGEGGPTRKDFKADVVAVPAPKKETGAAAVAIAAVVGIGLLMFNLGAGGPQ